MYLFLYLNFLFDCLIAHCFEKSTNSDLINLPVTANQKNNYADYGLIPRVYKVQVAMILALTRYNLHKGRLLHLIMCNFSM